MPRTGIWVRPSYKVAHRLRGGRRGVVGMLGIMAGVIYSISAVSPARSAQAVAPSVQSWTATAFMTTARAGHTATLLDGPACLGSSPPTYCGKVLVAGGTDGSHQLATAELYDPKTRTWNATGSMRNVRADHTATLLADGAVLVVGGRGDTTGSASGGSSSELSSAERYDPANGTWSAVGSMQVARAGHVAVRLGGSVCNRAPASGYCGTVLVLAGQQELPGVAQSAELYDPRTGSWSPTPTSIPIPAKNLQNPMVSLLDGDACAAATPAPYCGRALVTTDVLAAIYDPQTGSWSMTAPMTHRRLGYSATSLPTGKVLVAGGHGTDTSQTGELYDPATGQWTATAHLNRPHVRQHAIVLTATLCGSLAPSPQCGQVFIAGGTGGGNSAELYDPTASSWAEMNAPVWSRVDQTATLLPDGAVLMAGGIPTGRDAAIPSPALVQPTSDPPEGRPTNVAEVRAPFAQPHPVLSQIHPSRGVSGSSIAIAGSLLGNVREVRFGAVPAASFRIISPTEIIAVSPVQPAGAVPVTVADSVASSAPIAGTQFTYLAHDAWSETGGMSVTRSWHTATLLDGTPCNGTAPPSYCGKVLVAGGDPAGSAELYDPRQGTWTPTGSMTVPRFRHTATLLPDGRVLVVGGLAPSTETASAELYDPVTGTWSQTAPMKTARYMHTAVLLGGTECRNPLPGSACGKVLVTGGASQSHYVVPIATSELYDPVTSTWSDTATMSDARAGQTATSLPTGEVLVTGGLGWRGSRGEDIVLYSAELYRPVTGTWSLLPRMAVARYSHTATLLSTSPCGTVCGKVLVVGGSTFDKGHTPAVRSTEVFDPAANTWSKGPEMPEIRSGHTATPLPDGKVLVTGGGDEREGPYRSVPGELLFSPAPGTWSTVAPLHTSRYGHTATLLQGGCAGSLGPTYCGTALVAGGFSSNVPHPFDSEEVFREAPAVTVDHPPGPPLPALGLLTFGAVGIGATRKWSRACKAVHTTATTPLKGAS